MPRDLERNTIGVIRQSEFGKVATKDSTNSSHRAEICTHGIKRIPDTTPGFSDRRSSGQAYDDWPIERPILRGVAIEAEL